MGGANAGVFVNLTEHDIVDFGDLLAVDLDTAPLPEDHDLGDGDEDDTVMSRFTRHPLSGSERRLLCECCPCSSSCLRNLPAVCFEGDAVRLRTAAHTGVERVNRGDLVAGELEVEDVEILGDTIGLRRLRNCGPPVL